MPTDEGPEGSGRGAGGTRAPLSPAYAAILVAAILSALLAPICVSSFSAFISSCKLSLS